jgi:hypothetical protein
VILITWALTIAYMLGKSLGWYDIDGKGEVSRMGGYTPLASSACGESHNIRPRRSWPNPPIPLRFLWSHHFAVSRIQHLRACMSELCRYSGRVMGGVRV